MLLGDTKSYQCDPFFHQRQCELNKTKTCACQGHDSKKEGASYSFGCSWNVYHDTCKFAKNSTGYARKFKLTNEAEVKGRSNVTSKPIYHFCMSLIFLNNPITGLKDCTLNVTRVDNFNCHMKYLEFRSGN